MPDFFLDVANPDEVTKKTQDMERRADAAVENATSGAASVQDKPEVIQIMEAVKGVMSEKYVKSANAIFVFKIKG